MYIYDASYSLMCSLDTLTKLSTIFIAPSVLAHYGHHQTRQTGLFRITDG